MKTASSIRYGGMLVDANECDYTSFKHLGLLCPICKRTVFLVKESTRSASQRKIKDGSKIDVKSADIPAYFAHHPEVDKNTVNDCELRSKQITVAERAYLEAKAHNQRQKIFHAHFWKMLLTSFSLVNCERDIDMLEKIWVRECVYTEKRAVFAFQELVNLFIGKYRQLRDDSVVEIINEQCLYWKAEYAITVERDRHPNRYAEWTSEADKKAVSMFMSGIELWNNSVDIRMQQKIVGESSQFIIQKRQVKILETLVKIAIHAAIHIQSIQRCVNLNRTVNKDLYSSEYRRLTRALIGADDGELDRIFDIVAHTLIKILTSVHWAYQFELLEQKDIKRKAAA